MRSDAPSESIVIVSADNIFRKGLLELLRSAGHSDATDAKSYLFAVPHDAVRQPGLIVFDLERHDVDPRDAIRQLRVAYPRTPVLAIGTALQDAATGACADACLERPHADSGALISAVEAVQHRQVLSRVLPRPSRVAEEAAMWRRITGRQREVLSHIACGADNLKIAVMLGLSERTVKAHVSALLRVLQAQTRAELAVIGQRAGVYVRAAAHEASSVMDSLA